LVENTTSFDDDISPSSLEGIAVGDILEISGEFNAAGDILATRIDKSDDQSSSNAYEIHGTVSNLDAAAMTFELGTLKVGFGSATLEDFGTASIANGDEVEVEGTTFLNDGTFVATRVENEKDDNDEYEGKENDEAEIKGLITSFDSAQRFTVAGVTILTNSSTEYEDGTASDLGLDVRIEAEGTFNSNGELVAEEIEFESRSDFEISSTIDSIDTTNNTITVFGVVLAVDQSTRFEDNKSGATQTFSINDLMAGDFIEVSAYEQSSGVFIASKIEREDDDENDDDDNDGNGEETEIEGPIESVGTDSFVILGITIQTNGQTEFETEDDNTISSTEFFSQIAPGVIVEAEGSKVDGITLLAEEVELEKNDD